MKLIPHRYLTTAVVLLNESRFFCSLFQAFSVERVKLLAVSDKGTREEIKERLSSTRGNDV